MEADMDKLTTGLQIMVIGMGVVFIILFLLYGAMALMESYFQPRSRDKGPAPPRPPARPPGRKPTPRAEQPGPPMAVIAAAVAAAQGEGRPFRITSIKICGAQSSQWRRAGIHGSLRQKV
jgi:sodium pump decarboxylase gamma subunit